MGGWGRGRWGEDQWGASGGGRCSMTIDVAMGAGVLIPAVVVGGDCGMSIEVAMGAGVLTEIALPPPQSLRLAAWLRPAL